MWWPFRKETDYERLRREYEARLGRMTLAWNDMESGLDVLVIALFKQYDLSSIGITEQPLSLEQKLSVVRRAHNDIPELADSRAEGLRLANAISDIMNMRHQLTHGMLIHLLKNGDVMLMSHRSKPSGVTLEFPIMRKQKIAELTRKADKLFLAIMDYAMPMAAPIRDEILKSPQGAKEFAEAIYRAARRLPASELRSPPPREEKPRAPRRSEAASE